MAVTESSQIGEARRVAVAKAGDLGFDEAGRGRVALVATELATNMVRHGGGGALLITRCADGSTLGIELAAVDRGGGMTDVAKCLVDGYSTAGSAGEGLGAIKRLAGNLEIHTAPGKGSVVLARLWTGATWQVPKTVPRIGAHCLPYPGEEVCGDAWTVRTSDDHCLVMIADGLGHGLLAAEAARRAAQVVEESQELRPGELVGEIHRALRSTRGAAVGLAVVDLQLRRAAFAGIGNLSAAIVAPSGKSQSLVSLSGVVGHELRRVQVFDHVWPDGGTLLMHSDGLGTQTRMSEYPGLQSASPGLAAAVLFRDFERGSDDATLLVVRPKP